MEAFIVRNVKEKLRRVNAESEFYKAVNDKYNSVKNNHPKLVPAMTNLHVTCHFGEVVATAFASEFYDLKTVEAGVMQGKLISYAQEIGLIRNDLTIVENVKLTHRRRVDISLYDEDNSLIEFESKATSIIQNYSHESIQLHICNLKPDVQRLIITLFDWTSAPPRAVLLYIPDHTKIGSRRKNFSFLGISGETFEKLCKKISKYEGVIMTDLDLHNEKYALLIDEIVRISNLEKYIDDTPISIMKVAVEKIVAETYNLTLTKNVRSDYDASDESGRRYEVKCGTIMPVCDRHGLQAVLSKIKADKHDELITAFHLPCEDLIIIIKDFKTSKKSLCFTGKTLKILLTSIIEKSGGDKNSLQTKIYSELGDMDRIEKDICALIEENIREDAVARHQHHSNLATEKRKEILAADPEKKAEYMKNKCEKAALRRKGLTAKVLKDCDATPVVVSEGKTEDEARAELLAERSAEAMKASRAKKAAYEKERRAKKAEAAPLTEEQKELARAKKREYERARLAKKREEAKNN